MFSKVKERKEKKQQKETKKKKEKQKKSKPIVTRKVQSTQKNIPIKEFANGIVVTTDNRYVKILEVIPSPFFLKTEERQFKIYRAFWEMLRIAPNNIQFKCLSLPADVSVQINKLEQNKFSETNDDVITFYEDYKERLLMSQETGVHKRFFIIFSYEGSKKSIASRSNNNDINEATVWLDNMAARIVAKMAECDNKVVTLGYDQENSQTAEIFYTLLNREKVNTEPFDVHYKKVFAKYMDYYMDQYFYIPATDYIAPDSINFWDSRYLMVNNLYYKFLCIPSNGYNPYVFPGWINLLIGNDNGVDVDVFMSKETTDLKPKLKRALGHASADMMQESDNSDGAEAAMTTYASASYLMAGIRSGQAVYNMTVIVTVCGESPEAVDRKIENVMNLCKERDIELLEMHYQNEAAFMSVLPICKLDRDIFTKTRRNVLSSGAAAFYPFTSFEINDDNGIYIGDDQQNGSLVIIDYHNRERVANPNIFMCGTSGAGKTYSLLLQAIRTRLARIPVFIIAPEKENEFKRLCNSLGGQFIQIAKGSPNRINLMEIFPKDERALQELALIDGSASERSYLQEKTDSVVKFCQMLVNNSLNAYEIPLLEEYIVETYHRFGITDDNETLWNESHTRFKPMPTFTDLDETIRMHDDTPTAIKQIGRILTKGAGRSFNGQTNVNVNSDFVVFGLEHNDEEMLPIAIYLAMDFAWSKIKENRTRRKMLFIDEWWKMAFNPVAAKYSMEIARIIRAYSGSVCFATQQMSDILASGEVGAAVLGNCATKILMRMDRKDLDAVGKMINLSDSEKDSIERFDPGNALLIAGNDRMLIRFVASEHEDMLCATDEKTLQKYAEMKRQQLEQERMAAELENAKDIDDLFVGYDDEEPDIDELLLGYSDDEKDNLSLYGNDDDGIFVSAYSEYNKEKEDQTYDR